jgi:D-glycero-D-manno-heptose 1,7-bisphosphate phosphatase
MRKLIILDRDGVINFDSRDYIKSPDEWLPIEGSLDAIAQLKSAGFTVAVATNQSGIARGFYDEAMLDAIHQKMQAACQQVGGAVDHIVFCPHMPDHGCFCRKPEPGLLEAIAQHYRINLDGIPFVGDKLSDVEAALKVSATPILVETGLRPIDADAHPESVARYPDLRAVVQALLKLS